MLSKVEPLEKDIELLIAQDLSPAAQSRMLAEFAMETFAEVEQSNTEALGHPPRSERFVDGREGASETEVRPGGTIVYEFELVSEVFAWIATELERHSPVGHGKDKHPGLYKRSHVFFADGVEADAFNPPAGTQQGIFSNAQPYARKIDRGLSPQQPEGVYEVVTSMASRRFGNIVKVQFSYRTVAKGERNPAIIVTVR